MTKRDVAISVCRMLALVGMAQAAFGLARTGLMFWLINWGALRGSNTTFGGLWQPILPLGMYLFVWFFARGIGAEMVTPREADEPITSGASLFSILVRGAGLWLFLSASISFGPMFLSLAYDHFFGRPPVMAMPAFPSSNAGFIKANLTVGFVQSVAGFLLAFTSRLRTLFRS